MIKENKYDPKDLFLDGYDYSLWSENEEESTIKEESEHLPPMPPLEGAEEVKEGKGLKILTPNNSYKLKNKPNITYFVSA